MDSCSMVTSIPKTNVRIVCYLILMGTVVSIAIFYLVRLKNVYFPSTTTSSRLAPPPEIRNVVIGDDVVRNKDVFVVGDVHGCYDELVLLLDKASVGQDTVVIFLGDMINKGPKSLKVLDLIKKLGAYAVRGNHENKVLRNLEALKSDPLRDLSPSLEWIHDLSAEQREYLESLPYTMTIPLLNAIVVHAGLVPGVPLHEQDPDDLMYMRNIEKHADKYNAMRYRSCSVGGEAWASHWMGPEHVFFGHDAIRQLQLYTYCTGLDTGCVYGYNLTGAYITGTKMRYSVKSLKNYKISESERKKL